MKSPSFKDMLVMEDEQIACISKPPHYSSLDDRHDDTVSVLRLAKKYNENLQLCHRLDKETSGILVLAKNEEAYRAMAMAFEQRRVTKVYHAFVAGNLEVQHAEILLPLSQTKKGTAVVDRQKGKPSKTIISTLRHFRHFTLLECRPVTGRMHQIRIHLASQNFPLVADEMYGGKLPYLSQMKKDFKAGKWQNEEAMLKRVALHAFSLAFTLGEKSYHLEAPYPKDLAVFLKQLEKFDM